MICHYQKTSRNPSRFSFLLLVLVAFCLRHSVVKGETDTDKILFAGDSDIELWEKTGKLYPNSANEGVGGTTCKQWKNRIDQWLTKYQPTTVVLVCGENDLAEGDSPSEVFSNFQTIVGKISAKGATTIYLGTKPEPGTKGLHGKYRAYDVMIRDYYHGGYQQQQPPSLVMIDVYPSFVELGNPRSLYANDKLHMSNKGYGYWNAWLQATLEDSSGCLRWENGDCADGDGDDNNESTPEPTSTSTSSSTSSSTTSCSDDTGFRYKSKKRKGCDWVGSRPGSRCDKRSKKRELREWCPKACGEC